MDDFERRLDPIGPFSEEDLKFSGRWSMGASSSGVCIATASTRPTWYVCVCVLNCQDQ